MCTTNRYCKAVFLSLKVRVSLGENSHWKGGVWSEQSAKLLTYLCFLFLYPRAWDPEVGPLVPLSYNLLLTVLLSIIA